MLNALSQYLFKTIAKPSVRLFFIPNTNLIKDILLNIWEGDFPSEMSLKLI